MLRIGKKPTVKIPLGKKATTVSTLGSKATPPIAKKPIGY